MYRFVLHLVLAFTMTLGLTGCSDSGPKVNPVEGVVTLDGTPIDGVTVAFSPVDSANGVAAVGKTDASGVFKLTSTQGGKTEGGAVAGEYRVTFTKSSIKAYSQEDLEKIKNDPNYGKASSAARPTAPPKAESLVPAPYGNPATSGFKVQVKEGKNAGDEFKFDLKGNYKGQ